MDKSPVAGMRAYKEPASLRRALEPEEFTSLIRVLKEEILAEPRDTLSLIMLLAFTGMRLGEARAGFIEDVNFNNNTLFLRDSKSGDSRLVPLCSEAREVILMQQEKYGSTGLIFRSKSGGMVSEPRRLMEKLCEKAGIRKCLLHEYDIVQGVQCWLPPGIYMLQSDFSDIKRLKRLSDTVCILARNSMKMWKRLWP